MIESLRLTAPPRKRSAQTSNLHEPTFATYFPYINGDTAGRASAQILNMMALRFDAEVPTSGEASLPALLTRGALPAPTFVRTGRNMQFNFPQTDSPLAMSMTVVPWLALAQTKSGALSLRELSDFVDVVGMWLSSSKKETLSLGLNNLDLQGLNTDALVTLCRLSYPVRGRIQGWKEFVEKVKAMAILKGASGKVLQGLLD